MSSGPLMGPMGGRMTKMTKSEGKPAEEEDDLLDAYLMGMQPRERLLWRGIERLAVAVLVRAFQDLIGVNLNLKGSTSRGRANRKVRIMKDAHDFFFSPEQKEELAWWCHVADLDPGYISEQAKQAMKTGEAEWRKRFTNVARQQVKEAGDEQA